MFRMGEGHKFAALEELRSERAELAARVDQLTREREKLQDQLACIEAEVSPLATRLRQMDLVIQPLAALVEVAPASDTLPPTTTDGVVKSAQMDSNVPGEEWEVPEVFKRYMPRGGTGPRKRLRSTLMVADVVDKIGEPVTRDHLREAFYDHFGRENISRFWNRPDNALNTAIMRARDEELIIEVNVDGRPPLYTGHFRNSATGEPAFPALHLEEGR